MWVAEERGTFLVADSRTSEGAFSTAVAFENRQSTRSGVGGPAAEATLGVPPWRGAGLANFSQKKVGGAPQSPNGEPLGSEPQPRGPRAAGGSAGQASAATGTSSADEGAPVVASDGGSSALVLALDGAAGVAVVLVFWKILRPSERQAPRRRRRRRGDG
jgi:hypothetical protein